MIAVLVFMVDSEWSEMDSTAVLFGCYMLYSLQI